METADTIQNALRLWLKLSAANRFEEATWNPAAAQQRKLLDIVRRNRGSAFGVEHGFEKVRSVKDFQERVTPADYDARAPYFERTLRGEPNVLTTERPLMYATTSGTTGRSKYIPVTPSYLHEYSQGVHIHTHRMFSDFGDILRGGVLVF